MNRNAEYLSILVVSDNTVDINLPFVFLVFNKTISHCQAAIIFVIDASLFDSLL